MRIISLQRHLFFLTFFFISTSTARVRLFEKENTENLSIWVYFKEKPSNGLSKSVINGRALARRKAVGYRGKPYEDTPVFSEYIDDVIRCGARLRHTFKWDNVASFEVPVQILPLIQKLSCVKKITPVTKIEKKIPALKKGSYLLNAPHTDGYGALYEQLLRLRVPQAHRYIKQVNKDQAPGSGVTIALFDNGFNIDHRCFRHLISRKFGNAIIDTYDFVDGDLDVSTSDSHGSDVLAIIAAYDPPLYCGTAWGVDLLLARTESDDYELHSEEDNWAAAIVWAEEMGADIISSSVGYRDFDQGDTIIVPRGNGTFDTIVNYAKSDLDGNTTTVSRAAKGAIERGIVIVNAVGNEKITWGDTSLSAPADVDGVVAVGALGEDNTIANFSSTGPTGDGERMKPDCVAPGQGINLPFFGSANDSSYSIAGRGTSFSTPFVSGIFALVKHSRSSLESGAKLRDEVYQYCRLLDGQTAPDNTYGRGIPDAVRSCMQHDDEYAIVASDIENLPLQNASIKNKTGTLLAVTDSFGMARFRYKERTVLPVAIGIGKRTRWVELEPAPSFNEIQPYRLMVMVTDENGVALSDVTVRSTLGGINFIQGTDSFGIAILADFYSSEIPIIVSKSGYLPYENKKVTLHDRLDTIDIVLVGRDEGFEVFPSVMKRSRGQQLLVRYTTGVSSGTNVGKRFHAIIRSLSGSLVWKHDMFTYGSPVTVKWDGRSPDGSMTAPGIYLVSVTYDGKRYTKKFLIAE